MKFLESKKSEKKNQVDEIQSQNNNTQIIIIIINKDLIPRTLKTVKINLIYTILVNNEKKSEFKK